MHKEFVINIIARLLLLVSAFMLAPLAWAIHDDPHSREVFAFLTTIGTGFLFSVWALGAVRLRKSNYEQITIKDEFFVVGLSWIFLSLWGALPLLLGRVVPSYTDAVFEIVSGFTTTGASIFKNVEILPRGILFWRSLTNWLGGLGVVALFVALFPSIGVTSKRLYNFEASGLEDNTLEGQVRKTATFLWLIYTFFTVLATVLLYGNGMPIFDSLCHAFGTIATGGFSTKNASLGAYGPAIQWITIFIMIIGGMNFSLYLSLLSGKSKKFFQNEEMRLYLLLLGSASVLCYFLLCVQDGAVESARTVIFQVTSIMTTTGFATTDYSLWPPAAHAVLLMLMFIGGCIGSTAGGLKVVRFLLLLKKSFWSVSQALYPHGIKCVRFNGVGLSEDMIQSVLEYFTIYCGLFVAGIILLLGFESCDLITAVSASISALSSIGPGLGMVGPAQNYAWLSIPSKWTLIFLMLAGRLELYAILVLFIPATWRK
ncbi:MAG TPA: TrkH family potassium uptake protein [Candidatus Omnitrophota bacterium]|nr:TrkH family potassium uptake protein [Candidatus Omnitrophota bacterium]HPN55225.1 TrkH family potassium uptake protein [Candidatus Omnitrophota bacterium]